MEGRMSRKDVEILAKENEEPPNVNRVNQLPLKMFCICFILTLYTPNQTPFTCQWKSSISRFPNSITHQAQDPNFEANLLSGDVFTVAETVDAEMPQMKRTKRSDEEYRNENVFMVSLVNRASKAWVFLTRRPGIVNIINIGNERVDSRVSEAEAEAEAEAIGCYNHFRIGGWDNY